MDFRPSSASIGCDILSKSRVHPPGYAPCTPPHNPLPCTSINHHSPCLPDIQTSFLQVVLHSINPPLPIPNHWVTTSSPSYKDPLTNPVILHSFHMTKLSENTFINLFIHGQTLSLRTTALFMHSRFYLFSWYPADLLRLYICTALILDLSFFLHIVS